MVLKTMQDYRSNSVCSEVNLAKQPLYDLCNIASNMGGGFLDKVLVVQIGRTEFRFPKFT